jgi:hypothetical protein
VSANAAISGDILEEGKRVGDAASEAGLELRLLGGVAIRLHANGYVPESLQRTYGDIDLVSSRRHGPQTARLMTELGYTPHERFNALNSSTRLVFYDLTHARQVDIFVGDFQMCHRVPVAGRLHLEATTVPLAELLLTKLQVFRLNEKDLKDICCLVLEHDVGDHDDETINSVFVARSLASDWGLWRTSRQTIDAVKRYLSTGKLAPPEQAVIEERLDQLWERVEDEPKSLRWRTRARVGDRLQWHEEPEEVAHVEFGEVGDA